MKRYSDNTVYPICYLEEEKWLDRILRIKRFSPKSVNCSDVDIKSFLSRLNAHEAELKQLTQAQLIERVKSHQSSLLKEIEKSSDEAEAIELGLACVRELSFRVLGMRHHDVQMIGAKEMLMGRIVEMQTGEGKSLTAVPVAILAAIAGFPVHIMTVNDYLAGRDRDEFLSFYQLFGLSVSVVTETMETHERRDVYGSNIVYGTSKSFAFDYLKDRVAFHLFDQKSLNSFIQLKDTREEKPLLRGLYFALVDEADSILIDEARTPLIISKSVNSTEEQEVFRHAFELSNRLVEGIDFRVDSAQRTISWMDDGEYKLLKAAEESSGIGRGPRRMKELVIKALNAKYFYRQGEHYEVVEGKVEIVDEFTGRRMPDRSWEGGLHQFIELKEGVELSDARETLAQSSLYSFFERYKHVCGMSGTIKEVSREVYGAFWIKTTVVPPNLPSKRQQDSPIVLATKSEKIEKILTIVSDLANSGRPILIGTRSVKDSEELSVFLEEKGLLHRVLNAKNEVEEAKIIESAGETGTITIATNMAGRGTDIKLNDIAISLGGLCVLATEMHESLRIDRQLYGRTARQGDPGSARLVCCFEDEIPMKFLSQPLRQLGKSSCRIYPKLAVWLMNLAQKRAESHNYSIRKLMHKAEENLNTSLSFAGKGA